MMRKAKYILLVFSLSVGLNSFGQKVSKSFKADSIFVYKNFDSHGTTARLCSYHKDLDSLNNKKELINDSDLNLIKEITSRAKTKKLFQMKYGGPICFWIVNIENKNKRFVAYVSSDWAGIDDLDDMRRWIITDPTDRKKFKELLNKYWL